MNKATFQFHLLLVAMIMIVSTPMNFAQTKSPASRVGQQSPRSVPASSPALIEAFKLEQQLVNNLDQTDVLVPKIEKTLVKHILSQGPGKRYVIKDVPISEEESESCITISEAGSVLRTSTEFPTDAIEIGGSQNGTGSIIRFRGEIAIHIGGDAPEAVDKVVSKDQKANRLTFLLVNKVGAVSVRGEGTLTLRNGKAVTLGIGSTAH
jgi:hypothetical protein